MLSDTKMTGLEEVFESVFSSVVFSSSFRLPMSVKELRLLTERICRDTIHRLYNKGEGEGLHGFWGDSKSSTGSSQGGRRDTRVTPHKEDVPIGLNSLSKTFNIIQIVGQGNFGKVFKAENKFDHRIFAIKQIKINPKEDLDKVLQEVENLSKVGKNKNVVKYLDCFLVQEEWEEEDDSFTSSSSTSSYFEEDPNLASPDGQSSSIIFQQDVSSQARPDQTASLEQVPERVASPRVTSPGYSSTLTCLCIKMEFCDFTLEQLLDLLRSNRPLYPSLQTLFKNISAFANFKENKTNSKFGAFCPLYIIYQLLDGLIFIHNLGIVHRDLKPANIFIMQDGKVKIGDFGLSKDLSKESGLSKMYAAGTRFYMAPEFLGGLAQPSRAAFLPPADMFSLGMVILRLLGHVDMEESELFRINDKIRQNPAREIKLLFRREHLADVAAGTTQGNLVARTRPTYLPLLMDFLEALLLSLLAHRPSSRLSALQAKAKTTHSFNQIFSGDTYFRPKIGAK